MSRLCGAVAAVKARRRRPRSGVALRAVTAPFTTIGGPGEGDICSRRARVLSPLSVEVIGYQLVQLGVEDLAQRLGAGLSPQHRPRRGVGVVAAVTATPLLDA